MKIGLTFFLSDKPHSIWSNGGTMNVVFLARLLRALGHEVFCINAGHDVSVHPGLMLDGLGIEFCKMADAIEQIDVLIEGAGQVEAEAVDRVKARGGKAVALRYGNAFIIDSERVIHGKDPGSIFNGSRFDEIWTNAQHVHTCSSYWETCYRCPVRVLPHIWEPTFLEAAIREFPEGMKFGYQPKPGPKRISIFEPNINIVKTCVIPMCIAEEAHRARPELVGDIYVTNSERMKDHLTFSKFASNLDIVKTKKCSFEARYNTPWFLAKYTDAVVTHQMENCLNYLYYDVLYGGYPLIHNSPMLPAGIGYRYSDFDTKDGAAALVRALESHDDNCVERMETSTRYLRSVSPGANADAYQRALVQLTG